eukprot:520055_1
MGVPTSLEYDLKTGGTLSIINNNCGIRISMCIERYAYCSSRQFNLVEAIPTDLMRHCFSFLTIVEYLCEASLVCKQWHEIINIDMDDIYTQSINFKKMRNIVYNTCQLHLPFTMLPEYLYYVPSPSRSELFYEFELNTSFASLYTEHHQHYIMETYPEDVMFFDIDNILKRKLSYSYLLHYIYLYDAQRDSVNFDNMHSMLARLLFTGSTLCIGYMIRLFLWKYGLVEEFGDRFWQSLIRLFQNLYLSHENNNHLKHKGLYVIYGSAFTLLHIIVYYTRQMKTLPSSYWDELMHQSPDNILNDLIICVLQKGGR